MNVAPFWALKIKLEKVTLTQTLRFR